MKGNVGGKCMRNKNYPNHRAPPLAEKFAQSWVCLFVVGPEP